MRLCRSVARECNLEVVDLKEALVLSKNKGLETAFDSVQFIKTDEFGTIEVIKSLWGKLGIGDA